MCIRDSSTATPGANANTIRDAWNRAGAEAAVHYIIDDQRVLQTLPDTCRAWHAGGADNNTHLSMEICEPQECRLLPAEWTPLKQGSTGWAVKRLQMEMCIRDRHWIIWRDYMKDRVSLHPGRVVLTPVPGQTNTYDMTMADQPTQVGDPPIKANLLSDATVAALNAFLTSALPANPQVTDCLLYTSRCV